MLFELVPINWLVRRVVRWLAFSATAVQLRYVIDLCEATVPIAQSALQAARLREVYERACDEGACSPELQQDVAEVTRFLEGTTERALQTTLGQMDADGDGRVSLAECLAAWEAVEGTDRALASPPAAASVGAMLEAIRRAQATIEELERLKYGVSLAMEGAVAAVDADGDGRVSIDEMAQAPGRIAGWMGLWSDLLRRGKL